MSDNLILAASTRDAAIASPGAYVYSVLSTRHHALYVGQTAGYQGAMGRLAQHLSYGAGNTFRKRLCETFKYEDVDIGRVDFAAIKLHSRSVFYGRSSDYREAVEALVQYELIEAISRLGLRVVVISRVELNGYTRLAYVAKEATYVTAHLLVWLREIAGDAEAVR